VVDADGRIVIDQPASVDAIRFMADLSLTERVAPMLSDLGSSSIEDLLLKDKVAMFMYYVSIGIFWRGEQGLNFELAEVPQGRARVTPLTETALGVGAKSKNPDAAYRALRALVGAAEKTALAPARQSLARDMRQIESRLSEQDIRVITSSLGYARGPVYDNHQRVMQALRNTLETPVLAGSFTPEEGARSAATAIDLAMTQRK
jgi:multiple sugar transport system substrate-binding protein